MSYLFLIAFGISSLIALDQGGADKLYNKYERETGVSVMSFSKEMIDGIDLDFDWNKQMKCAKGDFQMAKLMLLEEEQFPYQRIQHIANEFEKMGYEKRAIKSEGKIEGWLFLDRKGKRIKEVHFLTGKENEAGGVIASFYGDVEITDKK